MFKSLQTPPIVGFKIMNISTCFLKFSPAKTLRKSLQDVGSDLVANLSLLADFYKQISELANWCRWAKAELTAANGSLATSVVPALDGTEEANHLQSIATQWNTLHADSLVYYDPVCGNNLVIIPCFNGDLEDCGRARPISGPPI